MHCPETIGAQWHLKDALSSGGIWGIAGGKRVRISKHCSEIKFEPPYLAPAPSRTSAKTQRNGYKILPCVQERRVSGSSDDEMLRMQDGGGELLCMYISSL